MQVLTFIGYGLSCILLLAGAASPFLYFFHFKKKLATLEKTAGDATSLAETTQLEVNTKERAIKEKDKTLEELTTERDALLMKLKSSPEKVLLLDGALHDRQKLSSLIKNLKKGPERTMFLDLNEEELEKFIAFLTEEQSRDYAVFMSELPIEAASLKKYLDENFDEEIVARRSSKWKDDMFKIFTECIKTIMTFSGIMELFHLVHGKTFFEGIGSSEDAIKSLINSDGLEKFPWIKALTDHSSKIGKKQANDILARIKDTQEINSLYDASVEFKNIVSQPFLTNDSIRDISKMLERTVETAEKLMIEKVNDTNASPEERSEYAQKLSELFKIRNNFILGNIVVPMAKTATR